MPHPFGMNPNEVLVEDCVKKVREIYDTLPLTTCDHKTDCCKAGNPNFYYCEFLSVREGSVDRMPKNDRLELTIECLRRYLTKQGTPKPCVFLKGNYCSIYKVRQFKCRSYGLIPQDLYAKNVKQVALEMGKPQDDVPLCKQCDRVKIRPEFKERFPGDVIPEERIKEIERSFREIDIRLGIPKTLQDKGFGFLTYHDWHLMFELGENWMEGLSKLRVGLADDKKEQFLDVLKKALAAKM
jgi:Fe-S-cluster containining protein